jgi:GNAT superfamily N-acetyltransferase
MAGIGTKATEQVAQVIAEEVVEESAIDENATLDRTFETRRPPYFISTRFEDLDLGFVQAFLATSYWASEIPLEVVDRACRGSLCFGLFRDAPSQGTGDPAEPVGFARVITDCATFGYLADVFVIEAHRGMGLASWIVECALADRSLRGLRRWMLATRDAHPLYAPLGFAPLADPAKFMEIARPGIYRS